MSRKSIVAGNWKMNKTYQEGRDLTRAIVSGLQPSDVGVVLCTPFIHLNSMGSAIKDISNLSLGAQNCHQAASGAYTGETSATMLASVGVEYVIIGHSERRAYFHESDELLASKVDAALGSGLKPIFCCGEPLEVREADGQEALVSKQVEQALFHLSTEEMGQIVIAYEPVWAIGTGKTASPEQAQEMHAHIRKLVAVKYGAAVADNLTILYGGSVKPKNAKEIFAKADVDGGLIGGASLKAEDFLAIVESFPKR
ncbi:MAG: triose-phosphate isomerase [Bacteroidota bacterium]